MFQRKPQSVLFKALSQTFRKSPKEFCFPKIVHTSQCPSKYFTSSQQIPVCWEFFCSKDRYIASFSMGCHKLFKNRPQIFCFPKFIHVEHRLDKYFTSSHQVLVCFDFLYSKEISIASCSRATKKYSKIGQRNFVS